MESAIDRVMYAFGLILNLTPDQEEAARQKLTVFLAGKSATQDALAIEGLRYLRKDVASRARRRRTA
jgi:hypothetical protein